VRLVSERFTKIINVPNMKDHGAAGVTGCLKNIAYGNFSNVARSHRNEKTNTLSFIGTLAATEPVRSRVVLNIMDGMRMVWHGGPLTQNQEFIYPAGLLMVSTDPVAMDTIELQAIDKKRLEQGAPSVWEHKASSITADNLEFYR
jgi:uncharacterized protein (DUF362 family)